MTGTNRRLLLREIAAETVSVLADILANVPSFDATLSSLHGLENVTPLDPNDCPGHTLPEDDPSAGTKGTRIRVYNNDTFDTALALQQGPTVNSLTAVPSFPSAVTDVTKGHPTPKPNNTPEDNPTTQTIQPPKPVLVLNLASEKHPGGGWLYGSLAQEEALCYRSSLSLSLHPSYYPLPSLAAIYSPSVLLIRTSMTAGHTLLPTPPADLPITSVISVAGLRRPSVTPENTYANAEDAQTTKSKIRVVLRVAAKQGHGKLVLGALGCGVFGNPAREVVRCFLEVFSEDEFRGGWWEDVVFAVLDNAEGGRGGNAGEGNFGVFYRTLDGEVV